MSLVSATNVASYASGRIRSTTSMDVCSGTSCVRASSRSLRLRRLRKTAECLNRGITKPIRTPCQGLSESARGEVAARTSMYLVRMRFPSRAIRCSSAPRVIRTFRGKPNDAFGVLCSGVFIWDTNCQLLPALLPTASKCCTTPLRFHTRTETVRLQPSSVTRTVSWLSHHLLQVRSK